MQSITIYNYPDTVHCFSIFYTVTYVCMFLYILHFQSSIPRSPTYTTFFHTNRATARSPIQGYSTATRANNHLFSPLTLCYCASFDAWQCHCPHFIHIISAIQRLCFSILIASQSPTTVYRSLTILPSALCMIFKCRVNKAL
jgi:hypothetical protein